MSHIITSILKWALSTEVPPKDPTVSMTRIVGPTADDGSELYDHRVLTIEEDVINRILRARLRKHWLLYSVTFEFEPNNKVLLTVITTMGNVMTFDYTIEDVWFDDYSSSFEIKVDISNSDLGGFILNTIFHLLGSWGVNLFGIFFNPIALSDAGSTIRFEKNGILRFDLVPNSDIRNFIPLPERPAQSQGPVLLTNVKTSQSVLHMDYYAFHDAVDTFTPDIPIKTSWLRSIDIAAVLLLPIGVWITFIILHHYLPTQTLSFTFSTYFLISLGIFFISFMVMNIPRYIYMYLDSRKKWQSTFVHNNIKIQMRKLHRRIFMQQAILNNDDESVCSPEGKASQARIRDLLLQIRDKRFLAQRLKLADEDRDRKQKVKFIIAYIGCTLLEWMLLVH